MFSLNGKDIWVFGGTGYLGQSTIKMLAQAGTKVWCVDLKDGAQKFVQSVEDNLNHTAATLDVWDANAVSQFVSAQIVERGTPHPNISGILPGRILTK